MLILSRREKQRIKLGDSIVVTVIRVSGDKVRIGIEAPADMLVLRDELEPFSPEQRTAEQRTAEQRTAEQRTAQAAPPATIPYAA